MALQNVQATLPQDVDSHVPPFESLMVQSYPQLQASLADHLHEQEFVAFLINTLSNITQAHFRSCVSLRVGTWLLIHPTTLAFCLSSTHFLTTVYTHLDLPHPTIVHLSWC
jgi:hypothetical protein